MLERYLERLIAFFTRRVQTKPYVDSDKLSGQQDLFPRPESSRRVGRGGKLLEMRTSRETKSDPRVRLVPVEGGKCTDKAGDRSAVETV